MYALIYDYALHVLWLVLSDILLNSIQTFRENNKPVKREIFDQTES